MDNLKPEEHQKLIEVMTAAAAEAGASPEDAHDAALDAYVELLEAKVTHPFTLGPARAKSRVQNLYRNEARRREIERESGEIINQTVGAKWSGDDPAHVLEAEERLEELDNLTPALRRALVQYSVEGLTYEEIAEAEGVTEGAIRERVSQAKKQLGE